MVRPRSRRALVASVATAAAVTAGGFEYGSSGADAPPLESGTVPDDWYDCSDVTRPAPDAPATEHALEPRAYPSPPSARRVDENRRSTDRSSPSAPTADVAEYVTAFERTYRLNAFIARYGGVTRTFDFRLGTRRTASVGSETDGTAVLVAIVYDLTTGTRQSPPSDEWDTRVTYYLDENVLLRARYAGIAEKPTLEPDPRRQGKPVACFR
ncbi:hypothetical protein [Natrinema marinum]|uniref:hypothetical protein n=1 Tax=Natrinema marinum TaxID=2961598 RepID=UPI0020C8731A|nr:hypothetical protein [Natrinema marinum]